MGTVAATILLSDLAATSEMEEAVLMVKKKKDLVHRQDDRYYRHTVARDMRPPDPSRRFVEKPPKLLPPHGWVEVSTDNKSINQSSNAEIAFYLHLRAMPGCLGKTNHITGITHMWLEPGSAAALLFVRRILMAGWGLPESNERVRLLTDGKKLIGDGS